MRHSCGAEVEPGALMCLCGEMIIDDVAISGEHHGVPSTVTCPRCDFECAADQSRCPLCDAWLGGVGSSDDDRPCVEVTFPDGSVIGVSSGEIVLGRLSPDARVARAVDFDGVSRRHAVVVVDPHGVRVRDLDSTNGTWVGGVRVDGEQQLDVGEVELGLGSRVVLRVRVGGPA